MSPSAPRSVPTFSRNLPSTPTSLGTRRLCPPWRRSRCRSWWRETLLLLQLTRPATCGQTPPNELKGGSRRDHRVAHPRLSAGGSRGPADLGRQERTELGRALPDDRRER